MTVLKTIHYTKIASEPSSKLSNSQPPGIGRVAVFGDCFLVNFLGRDVSVFNRDLKKIAVYDETIFPGRDEESQFDFDAHALLVDPMRNLWFINHYGYLRILDHASIGWFCDDSGNSNVEQPAQMRALRSSSWAGDVERFGFLWPFLVSSSPKGYSSPTSAHPGILVSERLDLWLNCEQSQNNSEVPLKRTSHLEDWGSLTGLAVHAEQKLVAIAKGQRIGCVCFKETNDTLIPDVCLFETTVDFDVTWMEFVGNQLIAAGPKAGAALEVPDAWEQLSGGGWCSLDLENGKVIQSSEFDVALAWGNGSEPLVVVSRENTLLGFDRQGNAHAWDLVSTNKIASTSEPFNQSRGIAHAVTANGVTLVGFNRDGYQLHRFSSAES